MRETRPALVGWATMLVIEMEKLICHVVSRLSSTNNNIEMFFSIWSSSRQAIDDHTQYNLPVWSEQIDLIDGDNHPTTCSIIIRLYSLMMNAIGYVSFILLVSPVRTIDVVQVRVSIDASNSWIVQDRNEGFIVDCGCYWEHGRLLAQTWREYFSQGKLPSFIFLTHTRPDNLLGLVSFLHELNITRLPVYVSHPGALNEMKYWLDIWREINPFDSSTLFDPRQSPDRFAYKEYVQVLDQPLTMFSNERIHVLSNFPIAESVYPSMLYIPSIKALFTGDLVSIRSHLLVSPVDSYPESDHHVCDWIGILQGLLCTFPSSTRVYSSHGDRPATMPFTETIETNIRWLTYMRALVFNSCNTTFVMRILEDVFRNYSNVDQSRASLANRIPQSAMSIGCKCASNSSNTCGGLQPPTCQFLPKNRTESLKSTALPISCPRQYLFSSSIRHQLKQAMLWILLLANIFFNRQMKIWFRFDHVLLIDLLLDRSFFLSRQ